MANPDSPLLGLINQPLHVLDMSSILAMTQRLQAQREGQLFNRTKTKQTAKPKQPKQPKPKPIKTPLTPESEQPSFLNQF